MCEFVDTMNDFMCLVIVAGNSFFFNGSPIFQLQVVYSFSSQDAEIEKGPIFRV